MLGKIFSPAHLTPHKRCANITRVGLWCKFCHKEAWVFPFLGETLERNEVCCISETPMELNMLSENATSHMGLVAERQEVEWMKERVSGISEILGWLNMSTKNAMP